MYLLDTHTLLWSLFKEDELSSNAKEAILSDNDIFVSIVSLWEIAIKQSIGKLEIDETISNIADACVRNDFDMLPISPFHLDILKELPQIHADPFDRLLIAQSKAEDLILITKDSNIHKYEIKRLW